MPGPKGPINGSDRATAIRAEAIAKAVASPIAAKGARPAPSLLLPPGAGHKCQFPHLEHFAARAVYRSPTPEQIKAKEAPDIQAYEVILGVRLGIATGRGMTLTIPKGVHGLDLAKLLTEIADSLRAWSVECERAAADPRDVAAPPAAGAPEGDASLPARPDPALSAAGLCAECGTLSTACDPNCNRPSCPQRVQAPRDGIAGPIRFEPPPLCTECAGAGARLIGCLRCAALAAEHNRLTSRA